MWHIAHDYFLRYTSTTIDPRKGVNQCIHLFVLLAYAP